MSPDASPVYLLHAPDCVVHEPALGAVFDLEAGGAFHIKRKYLIVAVAPESLGDRNAARLTEIERFSHVVDGFHLDHDVAQAGTDLSQGNRVVARVTMEEDQ